MQSQPAPQVVVVNRSGHGCIVTFLWFIFVGWWLSAIWNTIAWLLIVTVVLMPVGLIMVNKLPKIVSLRPETTEMTQTADGIKETTLAQRSMALRIPYFIFVGWWLSGIWMLCAWAVSITLVGLPLAIYMYNRVPAITTLKRY